MNVILLIGILCVIQFSPISGQNQNAAQIKALITRDNAWEFIGIGGRYGYMVGIVSKRNIIEADHFPPKSVYRYARDRNISGLSETNMAAVSLRYDHHRNLITTNNPRVGSQQMVLISGIQNLFASGNYFEAISRNIQWYRDNPDTDGNARQRFDQYIKEGVLNALDIHVKNELITVAQKEDLIRRHGLNVREPVFTTILNLPLRDRAKQLVRQDVQRYTPARG